MTPEQRKQCTGIPSTPITLVATRQRLHATTTGYDEQLEDDALYPQRPASSAVCYPSSKTPVRTTQQGVRKPNKHDTVNVYVRRRSAVQTPRPQQQQLPPRPPHPQRSEEEQDDDLDTEPLKNTVPRRRYRRPRFATILGVGMLLMLTLVVAGSIALTWWNRYQDDIRYGHPRTYQTDATVGHNDKQTPSHFIALNLHHQAEVLEFPGGDPTHAKVYIGPTLTGEDSDTYRVTVSFKDVNGDGKPDMLLDVNGTKYPYINDNGAFRPPHPDEHITV
jgi:hypothetical protein